ncbi:MAG: hypothetical protein PF445_05345, partial [Melioribacteraceae bacterium]|nr:hypothetical protein [Melioribacteraceae bacterium]
MKFYSRFSELFQIIFILLSSNLVIAQYSQNDSALVRTTFLREFDKNIINEYLQSDNPAKVNAALFSISHSDDTTFVDSIIKLDFNKYGKNIAFALGQLGESKKSKEFLIRKLTDSTNQFQISTFKAIGKVGDSLTLVYLLRGIASEHIQNSNGFPYAIVNFYFRDIKNVKSIKYLEGKLSSYNGDEELFEILFAIYRIGPTKNMVPTLQYILGRPHKEKVILSLLGNFRKLKYFPNDVGLFNILVSAHSCRIRTEMANSACYFPFREDEEYGREEFGQYFSLLISVLDRNPNVTRTVAKAFRKIKLTENNNWVKTEIERYIWLSGIPDNYYSGLTENTKGELVISYASLSNIDVEIIINEYSNLIEPKFIYRLLEKNTSDWEFNLNYLKD